MKNLREQSERISELQSLLKINSKNDLNDQLASTGTQSGKLEWDNFIRQINIFDRTNLVELLDDLLLFGTPAVTTLHDPYTTIRSYATLAHPIGLEISEDPIGSYKIGFLTHKINVDKEKLKTFRDYVAEHGVLIGATGTSKY